MFPKAQNNIIKYRHPKDFQFLIIKEERNQKIFTFKKLESENLEVIQVD